MAPAVEDTAPRPPASQLDTFLDRVYGVLFLPKATLAQLSETPAVAQGAFLVVALNGLEAIATDSSPVLKILFGLGGWLALCGLAWGLAWVLQKEVSLATLLTLTAFASLPWLLVAPAQNFPPPLSSLALFGVWTWYLWLQVQAIAFPLQLTPSRLWLLPPLGVGTLIATLILLGDAIRYFYQILNLS
ncbi:MAG: YIP1 family protein [Pseudanabaenaceae cyanobacterium]